MKKIIKKDLPVKDNKYLRDYSKAVEKGKKILEEKQIWACTKGKWIKNPNRKWYQFWKPRLVLENEIDVDY